MWAACRSGRTAASSARWSEGLCRALALEVTKPETQVINTLLCRRSFLGCGRFSFFDFTRWQFAIKARTFQLRGRCQFGAVKTLCPLLGSFVEHWTQRFCHCFIHALCAHIGTNAFGPGKPVHSPCRFNIDLLGREARGIGVDSLAVDFAPVHGTRRGRKTLRRRRN